MNSPFSRMSTWDIPHVPPEAEAPPAEEPSAESSPVENTSPQSGPFVPMAQAEPSAATAQVRFLNAVTLDNASLRVSEGRLLLSPSLSPGALSEYFTVPAGFRTFTFYDASYPWLLLFRSTIPLSNGDAVTLTVVRSGNTLDLVRVDDRPCGIRGTEYACLRCVNLIYNSPPLDLALTDGRVVFTDLRFKEVTNYRRARAGRYDLLVSLAPLLPPSPMADIETVEDLPMVLLSGSGAMEPPASFFLDLRSGSQVSLYLLGDWDVSHEIRELAVENF